MDNVGTLDNEAVTALLDRLLIEPDELPVFSFAAAVHDGVPTVVFAGLLFGPSEMAAVSWPAWAARRSPPDALLVAQWEQGGVDVAAWATFADERDGWLFGRSVLTGPGVVDETTQWITGLLAGDTVEVPGGPPLRVQSRAPAGVVRTFPFCTSPAGLIVRTVHRPTIGYFFPLDAEEFAVPAPTIWDVGGYHVPSAPLWVLGLPISDPPLHSKPFDQDAPAVPGLYLGRVERRAWISKLHADPNADTYQIGFGIDEERISFADLEVDFEEYYEGDLIGARRLHLGDIALPQLPLAANEELTLALPSLGPGLHRQVRLFDRDGLLLDMGDRMPTLEAVHVTVQVGDAVPDQAIFGTPAPPVAILDRLQRADQAEAAYQQLLTDGLAGRIIDDVAKGLPALTDLLQHLHGDLAVLDPYFGWNVADWSVLNKAPGNIRVLTGHGQYKPDGTLNQRKVVGPPAGSAPVATSFSVRSWQTGSPPWHDRLYLWDGGGLSVGTSPSGLGKRAARIDRVDANEAAGWQSLFDTWWTSADVGPN